MNGNKMDTDESRYRHLLSTNDEPPDLEVAEIRKIIAQRQSNLSKLEMRIAELQEMLQPLTAQHRREENILAHFCAVVAPVRRLPRDILIEIFLYTRNWRRAEGFLGEREFMSTPVGPLPTPSPLVITHVCSQWRRVALSMPVLWATIHSSRWHFNQSVPGNGITDDERFQTWLARTGSYCPLDITFYGPGHLRSLSLSTRIERYIHRIRALHLEGSLHDLPSMSFNVLETLSLSDYYLEGSDSNWASFPALRRVILRGEDDVTPPSFIPWQQLTHLFLELQSMDRSTLLSVLSQSPKLIKLHVSIYKTSGAGLAVSDDEHITIPQLETLIITGPVAWLFGFLTLPALTTLKIEFSDRLTALYDAFQTRSLCSLQSLIFSSVIRMGSEDFLDLLRLMPTLTEIISERGHYVTPMLVSVLASRTLVPELEYLEISSYHNKSGLADTIDDMILHMINIRDCSGTLAVLEQNTQRGVRVFRSQVPTRVWDGKVRRFPTDIQTVEMIFL
ncbi:hypothetical protein Hypma_004095 [Hypsizygus marmoreus]|uniref:Uncharacterized protein n=1 Tax=Hypsizygus marmoreus TaxID=39966 RepID=A0A369K976_HYPMA|nr:hypothetical protein Hypma_004095 [Hypsizygus marmoreus]